ncbi:hypothetical protein SLA2020_222580 [Shorea laevis]
MRTYCASCGYMLCQVTSGLPDENKAACQILKDYNHGKLLHHEMSPSMSDEDVAVEDGGKSSSSIVQESAETSDDEESEDVEDGLENKDESAPVLEPVLDEWTILIHLT